MSAIPPTTTTAAAPEDVVIAEPSSTEPTIPNKRRKSTSPAPPEEHFKALKIAPSSTATDGPSTSTTTTTSTTTKSQHLSPRKSLPSLKKTKSSLRTPLKVPTLPTAAGTVLAFGTGDCAQLGLGPDMLLRKKPTIVKTLLDHKVVAISAGGLHSVALTAEGKMWSWGVNDQGTLGRNTTGESDREYTPEPVTDMDDVTVVKVDLGDSITVALSSEGKVWTCGTYRNAEGILGHSKTGAESQSRMTQVQESLKNVAIADFACGGDHVVAISTDGKAYTWGNGQNGQLGRRVIARRLLNGLAPEPIQPVRLIKAGAGAYHSFAINEDGQVYSWGLNNFGQCGRDTGDDPEATVGLIEGLEDIAIVDVQGGEHHSIALAKDGTVYGFGRSDSCQLGLGYQELPGQETENNKKKIATPTKIPGLEKIVQISVGSNHTLALKEDGTVYAWGFGEMLACGNGVEEDVEKPTVVQGQQLEGKKVVAVGGGGQHSLLLIQ